MDFKIDGWVKGCIKNKLFIEHHKIEKLEAGIFFIHYWSLNWYHWIIDTLSKCVIYEKISSEFKDWPLLIHQNIYSSKNHMDALKFFFPNKEIKILKNDTTYKIDRLISIDSPSIYNPYPINYSMMGEKYSIFSTQYFSDFLNFIDNQKEDNKYPKKIFLGRKKNRRIANQFAIEETLSNYNFSTIYCEDLSFEEQKNHFYNASTIVGVSGAAWANMIFSKKKTKGLIIAPKNTDNLTIFCDIAYTKGINLNYFFYHSDKNWTEYLLNKEETIINIEEFKIELSKFINDTYN
jgi:capsular polysaccharide biosynthesis protein